MDTRVKRSFTEVIRLHKIQICKQSGQQRLSAVAAVGWFPCTAALQAPFCISERVSMKKREALPQLWPWVCSMCACPWLCSALPAPWFTPARPAWAVVSMGWNHNTVIPCVETHLPHHQQRTLEPWVIKVWLGRDPDQRSPSSSPVPWAGTSSCWRPPYIWHI